MVAAVLTACSQAASPSSSGACDQYAGGIVGRDGVKVRKMYLVRPDLLPYHMQFDAYC